jgi:hypothetical protein
MRNIHLVCVLVGLMSSFLCAQSNRLNEQTIIPLREGDSATVTIDQLLVAIREVETGGEPNQGRDAVGDNGNALGPFQIWKPYWQDATEFDKTIGGVYNDVRDLQYSRRIVISYWQRYTRRVTPTAEILSRIHNGGPTGYRRDTTIGYWNKVLKVLEKNGNI